MELTVFQIMVEVAIQTMDLIVIHLQVIYARLQMESLHNWLITVYQIIRNNVKWIKDNSVTLQEIKFGVIFIHIIKVVWQCMEVINATIFWVDIILHMME